MYVKAGMGTGGAKRSYFLYQFFCCPLNDLQSGGIAHGSHIRFNVKCLIKLAVVVELNFQISPIHAIFINRVFTEKVFSKDDAMLRKTNIDSKALQGVKIAYFGLFKIGFAIDVMDIEFYLMF